MRFKGRDVSIILNSILGIKFPSFVKAIRSHKVEECIIGNTKMPLL